MNSDLFYSSTYSEYYWVGKPVCAKCERYLKSVIANPGWLLWDYWQTHFNAVLYCFQCKDQIAKAGGKYRETKQVLFIDVSDLPADSVMIFPDRPVLTNSKAESVFDVATKNRDGEKIVDNAIQFHNRNFGIQSDTKNSLQIKHDLEEKDKIMLSDDADNYLDSLMNAEPLDSRFELEDKEDEEKKQKRLK